MPLKGVLHSYVLDAKGGISAMGADTSRDISGEGATLWAHLDYSEDDVRNWLYEESGLDQTVCDALLAEETRPRHFLHGEGIMLSMRGVNFNPGSDPEDMVSVRVWIEPGRIISMRQRRVRSVEDLAEALESGRGPCDPGDFIAMLAERITDRMGDIIGEIDETVDDLEDSVVGQENRVLRKDLSDIRRKAISLRRYIAPQRDMLNRLYGERNALVTESVRYRLREAGERTARYVEDLDSSRDRAAITHEELNSMMAEQMNRIMYMLSIVAGIFLPLSFLTGLLGINVGGIPGTESKTAFAVVCLLIVLIAIAEYIYFKRKKML